MAPVKAGPSVRFVLILGALTAITPALIDMYLPQLGRSLGATPSAVQLKLSAYLVGLAVGQAALPTRSPPARSSASCWCS